MEPRKSEAAEQVRVRAATAADLPCVAALAGRLVRFHQAEDPARFLQADDVEVGYEWWLGRELASENAVIFVAVSIARSVSSDREGAPDASAAETIVGYSYGRLSGRDWNALLDAHGALHDVWVEEKFRRRGIARALTAAVIDTLAK